MNQPADNSNSFSYSMHPRIGGGEAAYSRGYWVRHAQSLAELRAVIVKNCWIPGVFEGGHKKNVFFQFADLCGLDFDSPKFTLKEAIAYFAPYAHIIGTTKSHGISKEGAPACDRFRVAVLWDRRITDCDTFAWNTKCIGKPLHADPAVFRPSQYLKPCVEIVSCQEEGRRFRVLPPPPKPAHKADPYLGRRQMPPSISAVLAFGDPSSSSRHDTIVRTAFKLALCGFSEQETIAHILNSALKGSRDAERTARDGWRYGAAKNSDHQSSKGDRVRDDG